MHQTGTGHKVFGLFGLLKNIPYSFHNHHLEKPTNVIDQGKKIELIQRDLDGVFSYYGKKSTRPHFLNFEPSFLIQTTIKKVNRIIFGVVATRATKMWPLDNYLELAKIILNANTDYKISIPLSNSKEDKRIKDELMSKIHDSRIEIVNLPLGDLPQYFLESKIYIGNDTGLKHLAVASKLATITLFGPEPIREWHPYDPKKHAAFFIENLPCRTRIHHYCGLSICDLQGDEFMKCMKGISIQEVFNKVNLLCK
jgi:heptosyltransferase-2